LVPTAVFPSPDTFLFNELDPTAVLLPPIVFVVNELYPNAVLYPVILFCKEPYQTAVFPSS
jgi:hypothetical protein